MGASISYAVMLIIMRQIITCAAGISGIECKFQTLHIRIAAFLYHSADSIRHIAQILCDNRFFTETCFNHLKQLNTRTFFPVTIHRGFVLCRDGEIFIKASEMVDSDNVIQSKAPGDPCYPPVIAGISVMIPAIQRIAPQLSVCRKSIGRTTCNCGGFSLLIQLEHLRMCPDVRAVICHIDRNVTNDLQSLIIGIFFKFLPLCKKQILKPYIKADLFRIVGLVIPHRIIPAIANILCPLIPAVSAKNILHCHEQAIVIQPPGIFCPECCKLRVRLLQASLICQL